MHKNHLLWLGLPILGIVAFAVLQAWLPGRVSGAVIVALLAVVLAIALALHFKRTFQD